MSHHPTDQSGRSGTVLDAASLPRGGGALSPTLESLTRWGRVLANALPCEGLALLGPLRSGGGLEVLAAEGALQTALPPVPRLSETDPVVELWDSDLDLLACSDTRAWPSGLFSRLAQQDLGAALCLRLHWKQQRLGLLVVASRHPYAYGPGEVRLLRRLAPALEADLWRETQQLPLEEAGDDDQERTLRAVLGRAGDQFDQLLVSALGNLQAVRSTLVAPGSPPALDRLEGCLLEGCRLVQALRHFSSEQAPEQLERIELSELVAEALGLVQPLVETLERSGHAVRVWHQPRQGLAVRGNRRDLREALAKVLFNALQAMPQGGEIWLSESCAGLWACLEVTDQGQGMEEMTLRHATEPFFTTRPQTHLGLGLSVAAGILRRHGGELSLASRPGQGTAVRLRLLSAERA